MPEVVFRKQVSDQNYGSESAEVRLQDDDGDAAAMLQEARILVHAELARSPNARVRAALQLPLPAPPDDPDDLPY